MNHTGPRQNSTTRKFLFWKRSKDPNVNRRLFVHIHSPYLSIYSVGILSILNDRVKYMYVCIYIE